MKRIVLAMAALLLTACAGFPDPPGCGGVYRSLNPAKYTLKESNRAPVQTTLGSG
ncbi:MAG: hypothetical protein WBG92_02745 [Thiohalocapsa sp.]